VSVWSSLSSFTKHLILRSIAPRCVSKDRRHPPNANFPLPQFGARRHQADRARPPAINQQSERGGPAEATLRTGPFREAGYVDRTVFARIKR
jgi:hypothetical protein